MATERPPSTQEHDPFDTLLTLEDTLYTSAYTLGVNDGAHAGRIEGRIFGLEKGFEKFSSMGVLHGRALVWNARLPRPSIANQAPPAGGIAPPTSVVEVERETEGAGERKPSNETEGNALPKLQSNSRLAKNIHLLTHLTDPYTFSTENSEDAVADFDDRFKRAGAKAKIIEKTIGEASNAVSSPQRKKGTLGMKLAGEGKKDDSIEDFAGSRFLS